jgi:hypothetical protein
VPPVVAPEPASTESSRATVVDIGPLRQLLAALRRSARRWIWGESLALVCLAGALVFWGSLVIDWLLEPPPGWRMAVAAAAAVGLVWLVASKLVSRLAAPLPDTALATLVERSHPAFRDSLSTAIELADRPRDDVDPRLLARTAAEAASLVDQVDRAKLFRRRRLMGLVLGGLAGVASIAGLALARPAVADLWVRRNVMFREDPWPRQVALTAEGFVGGRRIVARGSDVDVIVKAAADRVVPEVVDLRSRGAGGWRSDRMGTRGGIVDGAQAFGHVLKNVTDDLTLEVRGGDARLRNLRLVAVDAPALARLEIAYTLPEYLGGGRRQAAASRIVQVPAGSVVEIACTATKPLSAASMASIADGSEEIVGSLAGANAGRTITASVGPVAGDRTLVTRLIDTDGLENREPVSFVLSAVNDAPPQVAVRMPGISTAVTPRAVLPLVGTITDDHGLASAAVLLQVADAAEVDRPIDRVPAGAAVVEFAPDAPERVALEPLGLAAGRRLTVSIIATDGCRLAAGPNVATSDAWSLDVVTPEALLAMLEAREIILRRRFESTVADLVQSRDRLATPAAANGASAADPDRDAGAGDDVARLLEASTRAAGETGEIAAAFRLIRDELANNALLSPELEDRLVAQIADPLARLAAADLPGVAAACRRRAPPEEIVRATDAVLARMRAVLDRMMELESFNEVVDLLRGLIRTQEEIRAETLRRQKQRAREALEQP